MRNFNEQFDMARSSLKTSLVLSASTTRCSGNINLELSVSIHTYYEFVGTT